MEEKRFIVIYRVSGAKAEPIRKVQRKLSEMTGSQEALRYPPHITLRTGFLVPHSGAYGFLQRFIAYVNGIRSFPLSTEGYALKEYGSPDSPRYFIGMHVPLTPDLTALHEYLLGFGEFQKGPQGPYHLHISLAYHDLEKAWYERLANDRSPLEPEITERVTLELDNVCLYEFDGTAWIPGLECALRG